MHRFALFAIAGSLLAGCNVPKHYPSYQAQLTFATHSTLEPVIGKVEGLTRKDLVAVVNLDAGPEEDAEIQAMVEDALVDALLSAQVTVVERDSEALRKVVQEGSGSNLKYTVTSHNEGSEDPLIFDAKLVTGGGPTRYLVNGSRFVTVPPDTSLLDVGPDGGDDQVSNPSPTSMNNEVLSATKVLGYRIVDVGVRDFKYKKETYRFANVVIYIRVIDADYGTVIWSGMVEEVVEDIVPSIYAPRLKREKN